MMDLDGTFHKTYERGTLGNFLQFYRYLILMGNTGSKSCEVKLLFNLSLLEGLFDERTNKSIFFVSKYSQKRAFKNINVIL